METQTLAVSLNPNKDYSSNVDSSRPFRSVKEAVAVFGERFLVGEIYSPKPFSFSPTPKHEIITSWNYSPSPQNPREYFNDQSTEVLDTLKKLEAELKETKMELKLLKKREAETEIALATLNAELHKSMSKLAEAEAAAAKKAAATITRPTSFENGSREEEKRRVRRENSSTLAQILSFGEKENYFGGIRSSERNKMMKKKPIMPLVTDFFFKKKGSSTSTLHKTLYASPNMYFN